MKNIEQNPADEAAARFFPLGPEALTVEFGRAISAALNRRAHALAASFDRAPFPGLIETVPAYASVTFFFDAAAVRRHFPAGPTALETVRALVAARLAETHDSAAAEPPPPVEIAVDFRAEHAPDLAFVAGRAGLTPAAVVELFTARVYRVFMLGFLPGFAYLGELDERLAVPRRETPRLCVPAGSVGLAGRQTGIYPLESPGGWQLIGRTDFPLFTPRGATPCALRPGELVRFIAK